MKHAILAGIAAVAVAATLTGTALAADISGAGSTFIYPVFAKWADTYKTATGTGLNYQSIGSGGGIKQVEAKTVTFGATDKPLSDDELAKNGLVQFPMVMGGIVPIVNIDGASRATSCSTARPSRRSSWAPSPAGTIRPSRRSTPR
jgi:phosphate transport system substrate-binding protein